MRILLFRDDRHQKIGKLIKELWDLRKILIKELDKELIEKATQKTIAVKVKADRPIKRDKKKLQKNSDSGSTLSTTQGCNGSGPMYLTTPGCIGSGPMLHRP